MARTLQVLLSGALLLAVEVWAAGEPYRVQLTAMTSASACGELETTLTLIDFDGNVMDSDMNLQICGNPPEGLTLVSSTLLADNFDEGCLNGVLRKGTATVKWRLPNVPSLTLEPLHPSLPGAPVPLAMTLEGYLPDKTCDEHPMNPDSRDEALMGWSCAAVESGPMLWAAWALGSAFKRRRH